MYCRNCGSKMSENDIFCAECGTKNIIEVQNKNTSDDVNKKNKKKIILVVVILLVVLAGIGIALLSSGVDEYEFEAGELSLVMNTDDEEQYYEDILHVHGFVYSHPTDENLYVLMDNENEENGVAFQYDSMPDDVGDGSEIIVTGSLGYGKSSPSLTILLGEEVEIINKAEESDFIYSVEDLFMNHDEYVGETVTLIGTVDGVNGNAWLYDASPEIYVRLEGDISNYSVENWECAAVTGIVKKSDNYSEVNAEIYIEVKNIQ